MDGNAGTNDKTVGGALNNDYVDITPALELTMKDSLKAFKIDLPYLALFGEYVDNVAQDVQRHNTGYMVGCKFGQEKVAKWGDWQVRYNYAMLGNDSVLDILPDSDRYSGHTGIRGHKVSYQYGLGKNTWLQFAVFRFENIDQSFGRRAPTTVVQCDWNMKF